MNREVGCLKSGISLPFVLLPSSSERSASGREIYVDIIYSIDKFSTFEALNVKHKAKIQL